MRKWIERGAFLLGGLVLGVAIGGAGGASEAPEVDQPIAAEEPTTTVEEAPVTTEAPTTTVAETTTTTEATTTTTAAPVLGTKDNPMKVGETARFEEWDVTYTGARIGTADVIAENMFNEPPAEGQEFIILNFDAIYTGAESSEWWLEFNTSVVGNTNNTFDEDCGVTPNQMFDTGEVFTGASINGNECIVIPVDQLEGALVSVEEMISFDGEGRTFFELGSVA